MKLVAGPTTQLQWPSKVSLKASFSPPDYFGIRSDPERRSHFVKGDKSCRVIINANRGAISLQSEVFLDRLSLRSDSLSNAQIEFDGSVATIEATAEGLEELNALLNIAQYYLPANLTLSTGIFIQLEELTGEIGGRSLRWEIHEATGSFDWHTNEGRDRAIREGLSRASRTATPAARIILAGLYFQHAAQLRSQTTLDANEFAGELLLNLAKALQVLFGEKRDEVRQGTRVLGFTDRQIEGQIVPILLIRDSLDVGHAIGRRVPQELIGPLRGFILRAFLNVQAVLCRASDRFADGKFLPRPLGEVRDENDDAVKLLRSISEYEKEPTLYDGGAPTDGRIFRLGPTKA